MANHIVKYLNNITTTPPRSPKFFASGRALAYVIGKSKFYEQPLPSDEILAASFEHFGFELERIERMRKWQSKTGLHEAVVFMRGASDLANRAPAQ